VVGKVGAEGQGGNAGSTEPAKLAWMSYFFNVLEIVSINNAESI
jgi:hypothetical protein